VDTDSAVTLAGEREAPRAVTAQPADIRLVEVTKRFDDVVAVDSLSLEIDRGSFFALLGPSGCGKTTTLRMIGGFEQPTEGAIYLGEHEVSGLPAYKRDVNTVFQSYALFPHLSVFENVAFGLRKVTLPLIAPAILAALLLCFAISIDDFVVTYFNAGPEVTFPLFVWGAARVGAPPQVNVLGTVIFVVAVAGMLANVLFQMRRGRRV